MKKCPFVLSLQDSVASKFRPIEELKRDLAQLDLLVETDVQVHHSRVISAHVGLHVTCKNKIPSIPVFKVHIRSTQSQKLFTKLTTVNRNVSWR